tara:strand:- start:3313 stop:4005 length:693 start_codon:yes stop_codon:yes gene_type:complete
MSSLRNTKCGRCGCYRKEEDFISNERLVKCCVKCRDIQNRYIEKNKEKLKQYRIDNADKKKQYNIDNADKISQQHKQYRIDNADKISQQQKQYCIDNADKISQQKKQYCIDNADKIKEKVEIQKKENPLQIKFKNMIKDSKTSDKKSNRTYEEEYYITKVFLNELWIKQDKKCYYDCCNIEMALDFDKSNTKRISIQRLNNDIAHIQSNCVFSCIQCNVSRNYLKINTTQ